MKIGDKITCNVMWINKFGGNEDKQVVAEYIGMWCGRAVAVRGKMWPHENNWVVFDIETGCVFNKGRCWNYVGEPGKYYVIDKTKKWVCDKFKNEPVAFQKALEHAENVIEEYNLHPGIVG